MFLVVVFVVGVGFMWLVFCLVGRCFESVVVFVCVWFLMFIVVMLGYEVFGCFMLGIDFVVVVRLWFKFDVLFYVVECLDYIMLFYFGWFIIMV